MTFLELIVAGTVFVAVTFQVGVLWGNFQLQARQIMDRARVSREARVARTLLTEDLAAADQAVIVGPGDQVNLHFSDGSAPADYRSEGTVLRREITGTVEGFAAGGEVEGAAFELQSDGSLTGTVEFSKRSAQDELSFLVSEEP